MPDNDICIAMPDGEFKLRTAALIIRDGKALFVSHRDFPGYFTIGGKIAYGEDSHRAVEREALEETGYSFRAERLAFVQERIFAGHHEVVFFWLMSGPAEKLKAGAHTEKAEELLHWIDIDELAKYDVNPPFLKDALKSIPDEVKHVVSFD